MAAVVAPANPGGLSYSLSPRKRRALPMTNTDDRLIAAAAIIGEPASRCAKLRHCFTGGK